MEQSDVEVSKSLEEAERCRPVGPLRGCAAGLLWEAVECPVLGTSQAAFLGLPDGPAALWRENCFCADVM